MNKDNWIYTSDGWLNIPLIDKKPGIWLVVIVGARQIGKTYGILKTLCQKGSPFIYLRRTRDELDLITSNDDLNPFLPLQQEGINITFQKDGKVYAFGEEISETEFDSKGIMLSLSTIAKMRGFSGGAFTDVFLDEFIPEKTVIRRKHEGDALLNAYTTINGNRELQGKPPLKMWLAANAFDRDNAILETLGLINVLDKMERKKQEWAIVNDSCLVIRPLSQGITEQHRKTAMNRFLLAQDTAKEYLGTALENSFAYDDADKIRPRDIKGHVPLTTAGKVYLYTNGSSIYVCRSRHGKRGYGETKNDKIRAQLEFPIIREFFNRGLVYFSDAETRLYFKRYFSIDK